MAGTEARIHWSPWRPALSSAGNLQQTAMWRRNFSSGGIVTQRAPTVMRIRYTRDRAVM